jgi:hypothetical protein
MRWGVVIAAGRSRICDHPPKRHCAMTFDPDACVCTRPLSVVLSNYSTFYFLCNTARHLFD